MAEISNILITGATGLIGSAIVDRLMSVDDGTVSIYAMGRNIQRAKSLFAKYEQDDRFHFIQHDVTEPLDSDITFHYIIHAASGAGPAAFASQPVEVMKAGLIGVANLMDYGRLHGMKRMLYISSGEVYGEGDGRVFTEDYQGYVNPLSPRSCYPMSKRAAETLCICYAAEYGVDVVIARPCHIYGGQFTESDNRVYAQFMRNVQRHEDIVMKSTGEQMRAWCHIDDCVSALLTILEKGKSGEAYNIADPQSCVTIRQLAETMASLAGTKVIIDAPTDNERRGFNPVTKSLFDTTKLQALGWSVSGTMEEKIKSPTPALPRREGEEYNID